MRAFLKQFGLFIALQGVIGLLVLWSYWRQYPPDQNFLAASLDKQSLIRTQASPRLIFIGGSSMAFGVNSARIAEACGRHPVNMGLHAAIGLKFMLKEAAPHIRSNDWVVVAPEYQQFVKFSGDPEFVVNMIEIDPWNARLLDRQQWAAALDTGFIERFGKMTRAVLGKPGRFFRRNTMKRTKLFYRRAGFNAHGDVVAHLNEPSKQLTEREFNFRYREELVDEAISTINHFARSAQARGARVFFSHPPLPEEVYAVNRAQVERLDAAFRQGLIIPQLDTVKDLVFPSDHFFDTWYHLARPGVERRTELLAERLGELARRLEGKVASGGAAAAPY